MREVKEAPPNIRHLEWFCESSWGLAIVESQGTRKPPVSGVVGLCVDVIPCLLAWVFRPWHCHCLRDEVRVS